MVEDGWTYVRTPIGRRRLLSYDDATMSACANTLIQGAGADILKIAIAKLGEHISDEFRPIRQRCTTNLFLKLLKTRADHYKNVLETCMKEASGNRTEKSAGKNAMLVSRKNWSEKMTLTIWLPSTERRDVFTAKTDSG